MFGFAKYYLISILLLDQGACQGIPKPLAKTYLRVDSFGRLIKLIDTEHELLSSGAAVRKGHPLPAPRPDYGITSNTMKYYLKHSLLSLCKPEEFQANACFCEGRFVGAKLFKNETIDSQAIVAADPNNKLIVVSYRMTVSEKNWVSNYKADLAEHPVVKGAPMVHEGHLEFVQSVHRDMEPAVIELLRKYKDFKLHITGYSLGASASAISLPIWMKVLKKNKLNNKVQVFTYSGPRPGNIEYAKHLESLGIPIVRYSKRGDIVPHAADQSMGFSQVGQEFFDDGYPLINRDLIKCSTTLVEDPKCALSVYKFKATHHITPLHLPLPLPPYC
ncbi:hypothetical protein DSO57_1029909 [Entomophthora muscae]|uniref:Uncharacterized protein n=1 Tax=Entomophthora muscae TaxID=34485 RepID=A0ACC2RFR9_9FUNG|nr:hypothetical protein DSO57_1029909 [Entomophthora muscae]